MDNTCINCKIFQIKIENNDNLTVAQKLCKVSLHDVYVTPLYDKDKDVTVCKVIYYTEHPDILPRLSINKELLLNKKLLVPTDTFPQYSNNVSLWLERTKEFNNPKNLMNIAKSNITKSIIEPEEIKEILLAQLEASLEASFYQDSHQDSHEVTAIQVKKVHITSRLVVPGREFISNRHKIKITKLYGTTVYYTKDRGKEEYDKVINFITMLNRESYGVYPFWIDLMKNVRDLLKPYIGLNMISWVLDFILKQLGVAL